MFYGMIECSIECPMCSGPVILNGPWLTAHCNRCQNDIPVPVEFWKDILTDIRTEIESGEIEEGEGRNSTIFGMFNTSLLYGCLMARCEECKTPIEVGEELDEAYTHVCRECGRKTPVAPPPGWLAEVMPGLHNLVAADPMQSAGGESAVPGPVAFSCPNCGGSLLIDGKERLLPCQYCNVNVYLPDDLWLRLHPVETKRRWFVGWSR